MTSDQIISLLPYQEPFLFVDEISHVTDQGVEGFYTFNKEAYFYEGHFKNEPITPGVLLTECMAQIGLVCLGLYLIKDESTNLASAKIALTASNIDFYIPVHPGETVKVVSEKEVFRFGKLKCDVKMFNSDLDLVCRGKISGMIKV